MCVVVNDFYAVKVTNRLKTSPHPAESFKMRADFLKFDSVLQKCSANGKSVVNIVFSGHRKRERAGFCAFFVNIKARFHSAVEDIFRRVVSVLKPESYEMFFGIPFHQRFCAVIVAVNNDFCAVFHL